MKEIQDTNRQDKNIATINRSVNGEPLRECGDLHSSTPEYADRFSGAVGRWMLTIQERYLLHGLSPSVPERILDVGGGHGQSALPLAEIGRSVTVYGSSNSCSQLLSKHIASKTINFESGDLLDLPFSDRAFDGVVSLRLITHCTAWRKLIAELCRTSNSYVLVDYPVWSSANILSPLLFRIKRGIEGNTRRYKLFTDREIAHEFNLHGFKCTALHKQFLFPMGLHRALGSVIISTVLEGLAKASGLTRLFGSPVIARFERQTALK
jgi:2-polyprenyl-3-methyl-5-hydroxy-6-metoxy-1,4-benzoquinol methylase